MATSGIYTITKTASDFIESALQNIGAVSAGQTLDPHDQEVGRKKLNDILFQLQKDASRFNTGVQFWQRETANLTLTAKMSFSLKPSGGDLNIQVPIEIHSAILKSSSGSRTDLYTMLMEEYKILSNHTNTGTPSRFYYEKRLTEGLLYLDRIPSDLTDIIEITYKQPFEIITAVTQELDIDTHLYRAISYQLSVDLWPVFKSGEITQTLSGLATDAWLRAQTFYPDDTNIYFIPGSDT